MSEEEKEPRRIKNYCHKCHGDTNHIVLFSKLVREEWDEGDPSFNPPDFAYEYMIVQCYGCESVFFRRDFIDNESNHPDEPAYVTTTIFPPAVQKHQELVDTWHLPDKVQQLYKETLECIGSNRPILGAAGLRSILDAVCKEKKVKGKDLQERIVGLHTDGYISKMESERLHSARFLGNDALHDGEIPKMASLVNVLMIIEQLLNTLYLIPYLVQSSRNSVEVMISNYDQLKGILVDSINDWHFDKKKGTLLELVNIKERQFEKLLITKFEDQLKLDIADKKVKFLGISKELKDSHSVFIIKKDKKVETW